MLDQRSQEISAQELALKQLADTGAVARMGLWVLGVGFGGFMLWAALAPLDEGVPTQAAVSLDSKRMSVQHPTGGLVKALWVQEGQQVKEGELLMQIDAAVARANYEAVRQRYLGLRNVQSRLMAEETGRADLMPHPDVKAALNDPLVSQQMATQQQLLHARRAALDADLQAIEESSQGVKEMLSSYQSMLMQRRTQLALINEELVNTRDLVKEGFIPRNRQLELERSLAESSAGIAELAGNSLRAQRQVAELTQRTIARRQEYLKEVQSQLADASRDALAEAEKIVVLAADLERVDIKAAVAGQVVSLSVHNAGAVVQPGQKILDLVPQSQALLLESRIPPHLIDKIGAGLETDIRFNTFAHSPQLVVQGRVTSVSGDLLEDPANPLAPYYLARVQVTPEGMRTLGSRQMQPGMPAEVVIKTGERSLLTYLLNPLIKRAASSLKEE